MERICFQIGLGRIGNMMFHLAAGLAYAGHYNRTLYYCWHKTTFGDYYQRLKYGIFKTVTLVDDSEMYAIIAKGGYTPIQFFNSGPDDFHMPIDVPDNYAPIMCGWRFDPRYFTKNIALTLFRPGDDIIQFIKEMYPEIPFDECVSINVRRGDYLFMKGPYVISDNKFYTKVFSEFPANQKYVVTSDDLDWCKQHLPDSNFYFIDRDAEYNSDVYTKIFVDLYVPGMCKHNIISNSTFSWWGAYLNETPGRKVYYQYPWGNDGSSYSIIPENDNWVGVTLDDTPIVYVNSDFVDDIPLAYANAKLVAKQVNGEVRGVSGNGGYFGEDDCMHSLFFDVPKLASFIDHLPGKETITSPSYSKTSMNLEIRTSNPLNLQTVSICGLTRNVNKYLREWVEYYIKLGASHIRIYDNNEENGERPEDVIGDYVNQGFVSIKNQRGVMFKSIKNFQEWQKSIYNEYYKEEIRYDWIAYVDIDEFIDLLADTSLPEYLSRPEFSDCQGIAIQEVIYDDNGLTEYDSRPVRERFTHKSEKEYMHFAKSIVRTGISEMEIDVHSPALNDKIKMKTECGFPFIRYDYIVDYPTAGHKLAELAHYRFMTIREWCETYKYYQYSYVQLGQFCIANELTPEKIQIFNEYKEKQPDIYKNITCTIGHVQWGATHDLFDGTPNDYVKIIQGYSYSRKYGYDFWCIDWLNLLENVKMLFPKDINVDTNVTNFIIHQYTFNSNYHLTCDKLNEFKSGGVLIIGNEVNPEVLSKETAREFMHNQQVSENCEHLLSRVGIKEYEYAVVDIRFCTKEPTVQVLEYYSRIIQQLSELSSNPIIITGDRINLSKSLTERINCNVIFIDDYINGVFPSHLYHYHSCIMRKASVICIGETLAGWLGAYTNDYPTLRTYYPAFWDVKENKKFIDCLYD